MNIELFAPLATTALIAIGGWIVGHQLNARRERINKHRDLILQYLISAYRKLENAGGRQLKPNSQDVRDLEDAVAEIQLFGSQEQVDRLLEAMKPGGNLNPVINSLRDDLRRRLSLVPITGNVQWVRH